MTSVDYSIIVPAYNEEKIIGQTINTLHTYFIKQDKSFELIIANDGSRDKTSEIVKEKIKQYKELKLVSNVTNMGKGAALTNGFKHAHGNIQLLTDADLAIDFELFPKLITTLENGADIVIGSKHLSNSEVKGSILRRFFSKGYSFLTKTFLGSTIKDYQCGFKAFKREAIQKILPTIKEQGWNWDTEVLVKAAWMGFKIVELPAKVITLYDRESKVHVVRDTTRMFQGLYRIWKEKKKFKR
ncbi:MAG: dolichyl-phosphate beta-glucosyltransferase [Candidatus Nanoarchaeia archaeon]